MMMKKTADSLIKRKKGKKIEQMENLFSFGYVQLCSGKEYRNEIQPVDENDLINLN